MFYYIYKLLLTLYTNNVLILTNGRASLNNFKIITNYIITPQQQGRIQLFERGGANVGSQFVDLYI